VKATLAGTAVLAAAGSCILGLSDSSRLNYTLRSAAPRQAQKFGNKNGYRR
jgi:hypothetical protein